MAFIAALLERARAKGAMKDAPMTFVAAMMNSMAETTMDFMLQPEERRRALQGRLRCPVVDADLGFCANE
jgi:hypothetical protein